MRGCGVEKNRIEKIHLYILSEEEKEAKETDERGRKEHQGKDETAETESQAS